MSHRLGMLSDTANKPADGGVKVAAPTFLYSLSSDDTLIESQ